MRLRTSIIEAVLVIGASGALIFSGSGAFAAAGHNSAPHSAPRSAPQSAPVGKHSGPVQKHSAPKNKDRDERPGNKPGSVSK